MKPRFQKANGRSAYVTLSGFDFAAFAPFCKSQFTCPDPIGIRGSSFPFRVSTQSRPTAHSPARFAPMCTYVQLRAPACAKTKNFQNGAQTAHNRTLLPILSSASRTYPDLSRLIQTIKMLKPFFQFGMSLDPGERARHGRNSTRLASIQIRTNPDEKGGGGPNGPLIINDLRKPSGRRRPVLLFENPHPRDTLMSINGNPATTSGNRTVTSSNRTVTHSNPR